MAADPVMSLKHWGNNLGVRLPVAVVRAARLHVDQRVRVLVEGRRVVIEPLADEPPSLAERLARFAPQVHGGEAMSTSDRKGAERW